MNELYLVYISVSIREISSIMILSTIQISKERQKCESVKSRKAMRGGEELDKGRGEIQFKVYYIQSFIWRMACPNRNGTLKRSYD